LVKTAAEFHAPVGVAEPLLVVEAMVKRKRHLNFATVTVRAAQQVVATVEVVLAVLPTA
jgi:hypothetical protein